MAKAKAKINNLLLFATIESPFPAIYLQLVKYLYYCFMTIPATKKVAFLLLIAASFFLGACSDSGEIIQTRFEFKIKELNDGEYPDNPDIGYRHDNYTTNAFKKGYLVRIKDSYSFAFHLTSGDSITFTNFNAINFIPETPEHLKKDHYLNKLALVNQEWNRNQVKFLPGEFKCGNKKIARVDIARNCLNSYLWEVILYQKQGDKVLPYAHGWFNFPKEKYRELFNERNDDAFEPLKEHLENWHDPESRFVNKTLLREYVGEVEIAYEDLSDTLYPLKAARRKKRKEVIWPKQYDSMRELQSDSSTFATFSPPGFYNKNDPRHTELGRFKYLSGLHAYDTWSIQNRRGVLELEFNFDDPETGRMTRLFIGGLNAGEFPYLSPEDANEGWKSSMGFGNHSFYESLSEFNAHNTAKSNYYAYLTDGDGNWLDSHKVGIDGPIFHWDDENPQLLHVWLLSFERHALIGHYTILFSTKTN